MDLLKTRRLLDSGKTIFDLPLKVAYYARVSTDRDEQLNSLENQITYYTNYIKENMNWTFCGGYVDEGISGTSVNKRDNFLRMIEDACKGEFDLIITKEISRFSRSTLDSIKYTQQLTDYGVGVYFQSDNINTLYTDAEFRLTLMASIAQDDMRRLSERVKFGMQRAYESGKVLGRDNIYGYDKQNGKLVINEKEAEFVRELFSMYAEGKYGYRTIARFLTEKGYRSQSGKEINPAILKGILTNPKYKGYYYGRLTESSDYRNKKNIKLPEKDRICYKDDSIPIIVSEELWGKANDILKKKSEKYYNQGNGTQSRFAYSGKIMCKQHNTHYYRKLWKDRKVPIEGWCCRVYLAKGRKACLTPHLYTRNLDAILEYIGKELLSDKDKYLKHIDSLLELYSKTNKGNASFSSQISKVNNEINKIRIKQDKILELYIDGDMDKTTYLDMNNALKAKLDLLNEKSKKLKEEQAKINDSKSTFETAKAFFLNLIDCNKNAIEVAQEMLKNVIVLEGSTREHIRLEITMKYGQTISSTICKPFILYGETEISPIVGTEQQSQELIDYLASETKDDPSKIWELNMFGKSMHDLVKDGLQSKLYHMPEDAQMKLQETLQKIINEGSGGLICIIL